MTDNHILDIEKYGQSIWMDNLSRDLITSNELEGSDRKPCHSRDHLQSCHF